MVRKCRGSYLLALAIGVIALYGGLAWWSLSLPLPSEGSPFVLYTNQQRDDFRLVLKRSFQKAHHAIDIWMYTITDKLLLETLHRKALEGVSITLRFDARGGTGRIPKMLNPQPIKGRGLMHRKLVLVDDHTLFLGSANATLSSLQFHDNLSVGIYHPGLVHFLRDPPSKGYPFSLGDIDGLAWLLPDLEAVGAIGRWLHEARTTLVVAMFTFTHSDLVQALIDAHLRGVSVVVIVDRYTAEGASRRALMQLLEAGVPVRVSSSFALLHHKFAWIDQQNLIMGSTNWTKGAFRNNSDMLLFLRNLPDNARSRLNRLTETIYEESVERILHNPPATGRGQQKPMG